MIRLLAAIVAPLVVITGLVLGLPGDHSTELPQVDVIGAAAPEHAPAAFGQGVGSDRVRADQARSAAGTAPGADVRIPTVRSVDEELPEALPLEVTMTTLSPAVVPKEGPVVVHGRVRNTTDETWTDVNVYACTSGSPLTTTHELRHAARATTDDVVCGRTSVFTTIEEIGPGASAAYRLKVDREQLDISGQAGAYWFGVQAIGSSTAGRDALADGTVRTFLPLVGERVAGVPTARAAFSLVLPIRARTLHTADGRLATPDTWAADLGPQGRLSNLLTLAEDAPAGGASLLVDPAVLVAVRQVAAGNPARDLGEPVTAPTDDATPEDDDATTPADEDEPGAGDDQDVSATAAATWLARFRALAKQLPVLALPYGDLDVAGASHHDPKSLERARAQSDAVLGEFDIAAIPVVVPPDGLLPAAALREADGATTIISSDALPAEIAEAPEIPTTVRVGDATLRVAEAGLGSGPGPTEGTRSLALRQRLLAEGLVRSRAGDTATTLVMLPDDADPGPSASRLFAQLDRPFVRTTSAMPTAVDAVEVEQLRYEGQTRREVGEEAFAAARRLADLGGTLDRLLARNDGIATTADREALSGTSYFARDSSLAAADQVGAATASVEGAASWFSQQLALVDVAVPRFVILGSTEGPFAMTVTNGLERPVRLGIRATTGGGLTVRAPKTIDVPASSSRTVNLVAETTEPGVHSLVLVVTDQDGQPVRKSQDISIRSRDVGWVIWVIMGTGATLLFVAIGLRWRGRLRASRRSSSPEAP